MDWYNNKMQEIANNFIEMLNSKLEYDDSINVNSVDELIEKYKKYTNEYKK